MGFELIVVAVGSKSSPKFFDIIHRVGLFFVQESFRDLLTCHRILC